MGNGMEGGEVVGKEKMWWMSEESGEISSETGKAEWSLYFTGLGFPARKEQSRLGNRRVVDRGLAF